jgi:hypothetical protein
MYSATKIAIRSILRSSIEEPILFQLKKYENMESPITSPTMNGFAGGNGGAFSLEN